MATGMREKIEKDIKEMIDGGVQRDSENAAKLEDRGT